LSSRACRLPFVVDHGPPEVVGEASNEALSPAERTAWVLHDLFGLPFRDVAAVVGRTPAAVRQLAVRARAHIADGASRIEVDPGERRRVADAFLAAAAGGDLATLVSVLDPDVVLVSDGGGQVRAALRPVVGANNVARLFLGLARRTPPGAVLRPIPVNGGPGFILTQDDATLLVAALTVARGRISRIDLVLAPDKLPH
jgi:RNA polymerase sigma-70 factor, ECF subfamily